MSGEAMSWGKNPYKSQKASTLEGFLFFTTIAMPRMGKNCDLEWALSDE